MYTCYLITITLYYIIISWSAGKSNNKIIRNTHIILCMYPYHSPTDWPQNILPCFHTKSSFFTFYKTRLQLHSLKRFYKKTCYAARFFASFFLSEHFFFHGELHKTSWLEFWIECIFAVTQTEETWQVSLFLAFFSLKETMIIIRETELCINRKN